ncbi:MAG: hypothetical protein R3E68_10525 [Burkholderiaceae bacterium]
MATFLLRDAAILDLGRGELGDPVAVIVAAGQVVETGKSLRVPANADATFDLKGHALMPGLIDCQGT